MNLHGMSIEQISKLKEACGEYLAMWFGFQKEARAKRTKEWIDAASKRLDGQTVYCCECGEEYPAVDLHFSEQIYCANCRNKGE